MKNSSTTFKKSQVRVFLEKAIDRFGYKGVVLIFGVCCIIGTWMTSIPYLFLVYGKITLANAITATIAPFVTGMCSVYFFLLRLVKKITESEEYLQKIAETDDLTGVHNRRYMMQAITLEMERAQRYKEPFCLIMIDVDHFKKINDTCGHLSGDKVLKHIAGICQRMTSPVDQFARWGGEEFMLLFPCTVIEQAELIGERIRQEIMRSPLMVQARPLKLTVSMGCDVYQDKFTLDEFLDRVDRALYKAKEKGRNRLEKYVE